MDKNTSEIAKLTERISRDPKSKLFVPLAEEYKKAGDIEMAVYVLTEGLKNNPGYVTARSFLGRLLFDMGDMNAARREFEEVVKTVPDNLLAQKKLGDLHVLLGNRTEALQYYQTARSLNPADAEIASLVSDLEAGIDVKPRIGKQKTAQAPEASGSGGPRPVPERKAVKTAKTEAPAIPGAATAGNAAVETAPQKVEPEPPSSPDAPTPGAAAATEVTPPAAPVQEEPEAAVEAAVAAAIEAPSEAAQEEPELAEEVLVVEPLEEESPAGEMPGKPLEAGSMPEETEPAPSAPEFAEAAPPEETPVVRRSPEPDIEITGGVSDDFTTDTLAELYIGQGFYEKAIDIYERMLADHPDSGALQEKLDRVRSLAVSSGAEAPQAAVGPASAIGDETDLSAGTAERWSSEASGGGSGETTLEAELVVDAEEAGPETAPAKGEADIFAEPVEYKRPSREAEGEAGTGDEKFVDTLINPPAEEFTGTGAASTEFEPREYIPPDAELRTEKEEKEGAGKLHTGAHHKQEVIGRLENWLKAIKKES